MTLTYGTDSDCGCAQGRHSRTGLSLLQPGGYPWTVGYGYDSADRLQSLTAPSGSFTYSYQAGSLVKKVLMPTGAYITNTFDNVARRTSTLLDNSANAILNSHGYIYNAGGQRTRQTRTDGSYVDYTYDNIGQLKSAISKESGGTTRPHENFGYAYDPANNLNYRTNNALIQTFNVDSDILVGPDQVVQVPWFITEKRPEKGLWLAFGPRKPLHAPGATPNSRL